MSTPIIIATAFGVVGLAASAGTAHAIASNQATKVFKAEQAHRMEDIQNGITNNKINIGLLGEMGDDVNGV